MKTLTGTGSTISETIVHPEDHKDKRTAASLETGAQTLINNDKAIKSQLEGSVMKEGEDTTLLGSQSAPGRGYIPMSDGSNGLEWVPYNCALDGDVSYGDDMDNITVSEPTTLNGVITYSM